MTIDSLWVRLIAHFAIKSAALPLTTTRNMKSIANLVLLALVSCQTAPKCSGLFLAEGGKREQRLGILVLTWGIPCLSEKILWKPLLLPYQDIRSQKLCTTVAALRYTVHCENLTSSLQQSKR